MKRVWMRAYIKIDCLGFYQGQCVYVKRTGLVHKVALGVTYWVFDSRKRIVQVSDSAFGRNIGQLVEYGSEAKLQSELDRLGVEALKNGQFGPKRVKHISKLLERSRDR